MPDIISRKDALAQGLKRYFTGRPCPLGHVAERYAAGCACVECNNTRTKRWQAANRERLSEYLRKRHAANPIPGREGAKRRRMANPEKYRKSSMKWYYANPEKASAIRGKRRARIKGCKEHYSADDVLSLLKIQKYQCVNCKASLRERYHVDHILPIAKGGENGRSNIQCLCPQCNHRKHAKDPIQWARENGRLL